MKKILALMMVAVALAACGPDSPPSGDEIQAKQQSQIDRQSSEAVGMPAVTNFTEKRDLKMIFELRDKAIITYTYTKDMNGHYHYVCTSEGYGIPYSTQFDNPQKVEYYWNHANYYAFTMPQADPNGLFSPNSADGTWVMCLNPYNNHITASYQEDRVNVFEYKLPQALDDTPANAPKINSATVKPTW